MDSKQVLKHFMEDTFGHSIGVEQDDEVYRHLHFSRGRSSIYHFTLTTWPGHLCIAGDCGTYVFKRTYDMFRFFRMDERDFMNRPGELSINPHYWAEKLQHGGGHSDHIYTEWSSDAFEARAEQYLTDWLEENEPDEGEDVSEEQLEIIKTVREQIKDLQNCSSDEWEAVSAYRDFSSEHISLEDFFEDNCREVTHGYIWCLYAIVWGIAKYDTKKLVDKAIGTFLAVQA